MKQVLLFFCALFGVAQFSTAQTTGQGTGNMQWKTNGNMASDNHYLGSNNLKPIIFKTNALEHMRLTPAGYLGIGLSNPSSPLHVLGTSTLEGTLYLRELDGGVQLDNTSRLLYLDTTDKTHEIDYPDFIAKIQGGVYAPPVPLEPLGICELAGYLDNPYWQNGTHKIYSECPEVFVGIGTDAPMEMLDVRGNGYFEGTVSVGNPFTPTTAAYFQGYTNLGNSSPWMRFTVNDNGVDKTAFLIENDGSIWCTAARVRLKEDIPVPDYVFQPNYQLMPLNEVKAYVEEHSHLPEIPSEEELREEGLNLEEMQLKLLQKVEELTLYVIAQEEEKEALKARVKALETELEEMNENE